MFRIFRLQQGADHLRAQAPYLIEECFFLQSLKGFGVGQRDGRRALGFRVWLFGVWCLGSSC